MTYDFTSLNRLMTFLLHVYCMCSAFIYIRSKATRSVNEKCWVHGKFQRILNPQFHFQLYISKTEGRFCRSPHYKHYLKGTFEFNRSETGSRFHRQERSAPVLLLTFLRNTSKAVWEQRALLGKYGTMRLEHMTLRTNKSLNSGKHGFGFALPCLTLCSLERLWLINGY